MLLQIMHPFLINVSPFTTVFYRMSHYRLNGPIGSALLTLYHEYTATFNRLNKEEQTIIKRQFINKERVNNVMNDMGLKPSAYRRRQLSARQKLAAGLNTSPCFQSLEITFTA